MAISFWNNKSVLLTGHTGFKGGWLATWLTSLGAQVHGYALQPPTTPSYFEVVQLADKLASHTIGDVRNLERLTSVIANCQPEIVLHLAAQPLVLDSYKNPVDTFSTNVIGTVNLLEAVRNSNCVRVVVNVTTDKCYENREWVWPYREHEPMGGHDPYSASKGCAELATAAYRKSFLADAGIHVATARAGNVIGGGDWAAHRLIPDFLRSIDAGQPITIRSPSAVRPWQHVLEPLSGYLQLAEHLHSDGNAFAEAWNFGPDESDAKSVQWIVEHLTSYLSHSSWRLNPQPQHHEANALKLDSSKAKSRLLWSPVWDLPTALSRTIEWHQAWKLETDMWGFSLDQIAARESRSRQTLNSDVNDHDIAKSPIVAS